MCGEEREELDKLLKGPEKEVMRQAEEKYERKKQKVMQDLEKARTNSAVVPDNEDASVVTSPTEQLPDIPSATPNEVKDIAPKPVSTTDKVLILPGKDNMSATKQTKEDEPEKQQQTHENPSDINRNAKLVKKQDKKYRAQIKKDTAQQDIMEKVTDSEIYPKKHQSLKKEVELEGFYKKEITRCDQYLQSTEEDITMLENMLKKKKAEQIEIKTRQGELKVQYFNLLGAISSSESQA